MTATTDYEMQATAPVKFSGPFTIRWVWQGTGKTGERDATWKALPAVSKVLAHLADAGRVHSIAVLDRHGNDVTFASDVLPLMEDVAVIHPEPVAPQPTVIQQPWGEEYVCCGGVGGHVGYCGS